MHDSTHWAVHAVKWNDSYCSVLQRTMHIAATLCRVPLAVPTHQPTCSTTGRCFYPQAMHSCRQQWSAVLHYPGVYINAIAVLLQGYDAYLHQEKGNALT